MLVSILNRVIQSENNQKKKMHKKKKTTTITKHPLVFLQKFQLQSHVNCFLWLFCILTYLVSYICPIIDHNNIGVSINTVSKCIWHVTTIPMKQSKTRFGQKLSQSKNNSQTYSNKSEKKRKRYQNHNHIN